MDMVILSWLLSYAPQVDYVHVPSFVKYQNS